MRRLCLLLLSCTALALVPACDREAAEGSTGTGTSGSTSTEAGTEAGTADTGEPGVCAPPTGDGWTCNEDADCALASDCCSCSAYNPSMGSTGSCGGGCGEGKCEAWGITEAECLDGQCVPRGLSCNQDTVICDAIAPNCGEGTLPQVWAGCWTGDCVPVEACDWAPDCSRCAANEVCMRETRGGCDYVKCVEEVAECQGAVPCACLGQIFCSGGTCTPTADGFDCG